MPRGDRTGPMGMGAMTGHAAGFCAGYGMSGSANSGFGRGYGSGFGQGRGVAGRGGRGWRCWFRTTGMPGWMRFGGLGPVSQNTDPAIEKQALRRQAETLQSELDLIQKRLGEIEAGSAA